MSKNGRYDVSTRDHTRGWLKLINSASNNKKGFDSELINSIVRCTDLPIIACGGAGNVSHVEEMLKLSQADAVANASIFHYNLVGVSELKNHLINKGIKVRR